MIQVSCDFSGRVRQVEYCSLPISERVCIKLLLITEVLGRICRGVFLTFDGMVLTNLKDKYGPVSCYSQASCSNWYPLSNLFILSRVEPVCTYLLFNVFRSYTDSSFILVFVVYVFFSVPINLSQSRLFYRSFERLSYCFHCFPP